MKAAYTGFQALTFNGYIDLDTGKTLVAEPGGVYDIAPASGHAVPDIPSVWFVAAEDESSSKGEPEPPADESGES